MNLKNPFIYFFLGILAGILSSSILPSTLYGQQRWIQDFRQTLEINGVVTAESSPAHLYILSEEEGLAVFRAYSDSLQWLYTSSGMQNRGTEMDADIRFAYIFGNGNRLSVIEPTSVLGVYSATVLPDRPIAIERIGNYIYIAMENSGIGRLSLETPESVDSTPLYPFRSITGSNRVIDIVSDNNRRLYALLNGGRIEVFERSMTGDGMSHLTAMTLDETVTRLFLINENLIGSTTSGEIFQISSTGSTQQLADLNEAVDEIGLWQNQPVVRTENGQIWIGTSWTQLTLWKEDSDSGNLMTIVNDKLWMVEYNQIYPVIRATTVSAESAGSAGDFRIQPVDNIIIPFPRPVLIPLELENASSSQSEQVEFIYRSDIQNAQIRGQSLHWQPTAAQIGRHQFQLFATTSSGRSDSTSFTVDVRPFNSPPRFTPVQRLTIPLSEEFTLQITAIDPDGLSQNMVRFLGVDLPQGARLDEQTGEFTWTPSIRQVGDYQFQVIATDQYGAAAQQSVTIRVIETNPDAEAAID